MAFLSLLCSFHRGLVLYLLNSHIFFPSCFCFPVNSVPFRVVQDVIRDRGLERQNDTYIDVLTAGNALSLLYRKLKEQGNDRVRIDESSDILLSFLFSTYDTYVLAGPPPFFSHGLCFTSCCHCYS